VIDRIGLPGKGGPVVEAIRVDDGAGARCGLADRADINAAALADQELGSAGAKAVAFDRDQSAAWMSTDPLGSLVVRVLWARQNEQPQARSRVSAGICDRRRLRRRLPQ